MLTWMIYVVVVSVLLGAGAFCAERALRVNPGSSRWIWLTCILASLILPVLMSSVTIPVPNIVSPMTIDRIVPLNSVTSSALSSVLWLAGSGGEVEGEVEGEVNALDNIDSLLELFWLVVSVLLAMGLAASELHLLRRKRRWRKTTLNGTDIFVSRNAGPAVVGLLRPRIVLPEWIMRTSTSRQSVVLAHEQSHLDAGDQKLLTAGLCLLIFMPWNFPLWWQLRRLRRAIEVDCDSRVLKQGHSTKNYVEALIEVGQRKSAAIGAVAAMSESISFLEQRIKLMTSTPSKLWRVPAVGFGILSFACLTVACQINPPIISLSEAVLDRYVGFYYFAEVPRVVTVTRDAQQLSTHRPGMSSGVKIYPVSETTFLQTEGQGRDRTVEFILDGQGPATALVEHIVDGPDRPAERIDEATAAQINAAFTARFEAPEATPGTEAALRRLMEGITSGAPNYAEMAPALAEAVREQLPRMQSQLQSAGEILSVEFQSLNNFGADVYEVRYENDEAQWTIFVLANGTIGGANVTSSRNFWQRIFGG